MSLIFIFPNDMPGDNSCKNNLQLSFTGKDLLDVRNSAGQTAFHLAVSEEMRQLLFDLQPPVESSFPDSQGLSIIFPLRRKHEKTYIILSFDMFTVLFLKYSNNLSSLQRINYHY